jgi:F-type H+-transporting ATPase subunit delta
MTGASGVARRWARALFGLAEGLDEANVLFEELRALNEQVVESPELQRVLLTPIHPRAERRGVIGELCEKLQLSREIRTFAMLLVDENRARELASICDALKRLVDEASGRVTAEVTSARPLDEAELERLRQALSRRVNAEVTLEAHVDASLIGGVVARVGDLLVDGSVRSQLESLSDNLRRG